MLAFEKKHWLVCPVLPSQDWWACGEERLLRFRWDLQDRCARPGDRGGSLGTAFDLAALHLHSQSLLWGGSWTRKPSWCSKQKQRNTVRAMTLLCTAAWRDKKVFVQVYPFWRYTGMSSIAFRGNRRSSLRTCCFQETNLFLWVSENAWIKEKERRTESDL